ncbi:MAG: hypothetical protein CSA22_05880 [Deltaproteobacteria bacterium]|nr:MAG: hypothetical protein CSA22_05880 [Deltaproteobacteria bacterium]
MQFFDYTPYFRAYETLAKTADAVFHRVQSEFPDEVKCQSKCADCCYALFDLTLVEALYINHHFNKKWSGIERLNRLDRANTADRRIHKLKRNAHRSHKDGASDVEILGQMALERVRCPLLNSDNQCDLYDHRPITCRLYGIPVASTGITHTCGLSGFEQGGKYPTVNIDKLHDQLLAISKRIARDVNTQYTGLWEMLVPVSMALLTDYDETYMGVPMAQVKKKDEGEVSHGG